MNKIFLWLMILG